MDDRCDKIESTLLALQAAPAQFAAKNTNTINSVHDRIDNLEVILRDSTKRVIREESRSAPGKGGPKLNDKYATLAMDLKMLRGEANTLDNSGNGTREVEEKLDTITRRILDDQAKLGKQANEQIANAIQGISRVESQLRATALDPPSRSSSAYITDEWRTMSTATPSDPVCSPPQMMSPSASPPQMASPQMESRNPSRVMSRPEGGLGVSDMAPTQRLLPQQRVASSSPQMQSRQMASPQTVSRYPQSGMVRGWSREEVRPPTYAGGS